MNGLRPLIFIVMLALAGCTKPAGPVAVNPAAGVTLLTELPSPSGDDTRATSRQSFVGPFTELAIEVFGVPDLRREVLTDGEGKFTFPLAGTIEASGKTPQQLAIEIEERLAGRYVRDPNVSVNFKASTNPLLMQAQSVTVDGEVIKPGQFPIFGKATLMRAIALAGGTSEFAKLEDVLIFRKVEGRQYVGAYNLQAIRRGNYADPEIYPNDVVVVGDSPQRRLFDNILKASTLLSTPLIILGNQL